MGTENRPPAVRGEGGEEWVKKVRGLTKSPHKTQKPQYGDCERGGGVGGWKRVKGG